MSELLKKQNYGVEVEFTGISRKMFFRDLFRSLF